MTPRIFYKFIVSDLARRVGVEPTILNLSVRFWRPRITPMSRRKNLPTIHFIMPFSIEIPIFSGTSQIGEFPNNKSGAYGNEKEYHDNFFKSRDDQTRTGILAAPNRVVFQLTSHPYLIPTSDFNVWARVPSPDIFMSLESFFAIHMGFEPKPGRNFSYWILYCPVRTIHR